MIRPGGKTCRRERVEGSQIGEVEDVRGFQSCWWHFWSHSWWGQDPLELEGGADIGNGYFLTQSCYEMCNFATFFCSVIVKKFLIFVSL